MKKNTITNILIIVGIASIIILYLVFGWIFGFEYLLSNKFSHIPYYKLADRNAVMKFINSDSASVHVNGEEWSLNYSIGGTYKADSENMEVDLTYSKPFVGTQLASEHYLSDYDDFFAIVDNAAKKFLRVTGVVLSDAEEKLFNRKVTSSMIAFENFCMGYIENASPDRDEEKVIACKLCEEAGADWVKTSTGFSPSGATLDDLRLMRDTVSEKVQVKAAGGVRTLDAIIPVIDVGCTRVGATATAVIMDEFERRGGAGKVESNEIPEDTTGY